MAKSEQFDKNILAKTVVTYQNLLKFILTVQGKRFCLLFVVILSFVCILRLHLKHIALETLKAHDDTIDRS
jgi:hypothetical protein